MTAVVGPDGYIYDPRVVRGLGYGLDRRAVKAVLTWRFKPAICQGGPAGVRVQITMAFRLW